MRRRDAETRAVWKESPCFPAEASVPEELADVQQLAGSSSHPDFNAYVIFKRKALSELKGWEAGVCQSETACRRGRRWYLL